MQGVGYPDPNRSHFRSMEIWQTGTVGPAPPAGWLGRLGDAHTPLELCHVGQGSMPLAMQGRKVVAQSLASVAAYRLGSGAELPSRFKEESGKPPLAEIRQRYTSSVELARRLEILRGGKIASGDAETLEGRLETIRSLIEADTPCRVYYTAQDGFDTHAGPALCPSAALADDGESLGRVPRQPETEQARRASRGPGLFGVRPPAQGERQRRHRPRGGGPGADRRLAPSREASSAHTPTWPISTRPAIPVSPSISATSTRRSSAVGWTSTRRRSWANAKQP